jgi:hypothetical protein
MSTQEIRNSSKMSTQQIRNSGKKSTIGSNGNHPASQPASQPANSKIDRLRVTSKVVTKTTSGSTQFVGPLSETSDCLLRFVTNSMLPLVGLSRGHTSPLVWIAYSTLLRKTMKTFRKNKEDLKHQTTDTQAIHASGSWA